jgi:NADH dehydrogenase [ubiquinone] 1 alpha subcomplex assembly factor 6
MEGRRLQSQQRRCFSSSFSGGNQSSPRKKDFDYCIDLVQNRDRESYLCGLLLPYEARKAYFAVRAYNVELASIKGGSVSRQVGGAQFADESGANLALKVRTQWWRDAIQQIYTEDGNNDDDNNNINPTAGSTEDDDAVFFASMATSYYKNPVVRVLHHAVHDKHLTRRFLERLLEAREMDLDVRQPGTIRDMVQYSDNIFSSLLYLSLETVNVRNEDADIMAQHAGIGIGLVTALRGARIRLSGGEFAIPQELIPTQFPYHKLYNLNDDLRVELSDEEHRMLKGAVEEICAVAHAHFSIVQESLKRQDVIPKHARPCFLPMIPAMHYLSKLEKANFDIFDDSLLVQDHLTILYKLTRSWLTGTV